MEVELTYASTAVAFAAQQDTWEAKPGAKVVLFSKKKEAPSALKALSTKYRQRLSFGFVDEVC